MSEKKPDLPIVHLPWSAWQDITARLDALEAAVFRAKRQPEESPSDRAIRGIKDGFAQRLTEAAPPPPAHCGYFEEVLASAAPPPPAAAPAPDVARGSERVRDYLRRALSDADQDTSLFLVGEALRLLGDAP